MDKIVGAEDLLLSLKKWGKISLMKLTLAGGKKISSDEIERSSYLTYRIRNYLVHSVLINQINIRPRLRKIVMKQPGSPIPGR